MNSIKKSILFTALFLFIAAGSFAVGTPQADAATKLSKVKNVSVVTKDNTNITLKWKKVKGATYQVKVMNKNKKKLRLVKAKKKKKKITKLKKNTKYYFKVRAEQKKKRGKWSKIKGVRTANETADPGDADPGDGDPAPGDGDGDVDPGDPAPGDGDGGTTPAVDFSNAAYSGTEEGGAITISVGLSAAASSAVTVDYATSDGTATAGTDYTAVTGTMTFAAGETSGTFTVTPIADTDNEDNETITLTLSGASGATVSTVSNPATVTITDNDVLTISSASFTNNANIPVTFTCDAPGGGGTSPEVNWVSAPAGTQSFVLIVRDIDASDYIHWVVKDIPVTTTGSAQGGDPVGGMTVLNSEGNDYYDGPCPPVEDASHTYQFEIYALDTATVSGTTGAELDVNMLPNILETSIISGEYDA